MAFFPLIIVFCKLASAKSNFDRTINSKLDSIPRGAMRISTTIVYTILRIADLGDTIGKGRSR